MNPHTRLALCALFTGAAFGQAPHISAIVNSASGQVGYGLAANTWLTIYGENLSPSTDTWAGQGTSLDGVRVYIALPSCCIDIIGPPPPGYPQGGVSIASEYYPATISYVSPTQINMMVQPYMLSPGNIHGRLDHTRHKAGVCQTSISSCRLSRLRCCPLGLP
jgi:uncharacterized protein (TIGR03437 family)